MTIIEQIDADFKAAFKSGDKAKKDFLGVVRGEIQTAKSRPGFGEVTDENVTKILKAMEKSLVQTLEAKPDSADDVAALEIVRGYLPQQMTEGEIEAEISAIVSTGASNIGAIMKEFNSKFAGKADNKVVSRIAGEKLKT